LPNTNPTKTKQKITQHEPHQNKTKDCPTRVGQSFVLFWVGSCWAIFCFVLVGFVLGNLLLCFGGVRDEATFYTNPTKTKQKIAQHEPRQNKEKDCPT
jgi:hypothetical protein